MNVICYYSNKHKKINGTLFYCLEYYLFLKQYIDIEFIVFNATNEDLIFFKEIFKEKYNISKEELNSIINVEKRTIFAKLDIKNLMLLDIHSYSKLKDFTYYIKKIRVYSNEPHNFKNHKTTFYGFYEYQNFEKKTRLKFFKDVHKTYKSKGTKSLVSTVSFNFEEIIPKLNLSKEDIFCKTANEHNNNLFKSINKIIYWHSGLIDTNNRIVVESYIHNIELEVHINNNKKDSIFERTEELKKNGLKNFILEKDDILISDFLKDCNEFK